MNLMEEIFKLDNDAFPEVKHFGWGRSTSEDQDELVQWSSGEAVQWSDGNSVQFSN